MISISTKSTMSEELVAAAIATTIISKRRSAERKRKRKTVWVTPCVCRRPNFGDYHTLLSELRLPDRKEFKTYLPMTSEIFEYIFHFIKTT